MGFCRRVLGFAIFLMFAPAFAETRTCPAAADIHHKFDLWSKGTCLRGANIWQKRLVPEYDGDGFGPGPIGPPITQSEFDRLSALGANYVNFSIPGVFSETPPYVLDLQAVVQLDNLVAMAAKANLFVVISFRSGPGRNEAVFDANLKDRALQTVWTDRRAQDGWGAMWAYVAHRYQASAHVVGYDLMVEPNANLSMLGTGNPLDFYPAYAGSLYDWNPFAAKISKAIRNVDAEMPLLVGAMNYSDLNWLNFLKPTGDPRTVYTVHPYDPGEYTNQLPSAPLSYPDAFNQGWLKENMRPVDDFAAAQKVPVAANEYGVIRWAPGADQYVTDLLNIFEQKNLNHAVWLWETEYPIDFDEFNFRHGPNPSCHVDVDDNAYLNALRSNWTKNRLRPSDVKWATAPSARRRQ